MRTSTPKRPNGLWEVDRFPICGHDGGRYVRGNIVPSCPSCNAKRCGKAGGRCRGRAPLAKKVRFLAYAMELARQLGVPEEELGVDVGSL